MALNMVMDLYVMVIIKKSAVRWSQRNTLFYVTSDLT